MSVTAVFTNDTLTETWSSTNQSDSWAADTPTGGSVTRKLGVPTTQSQNTLTKTEAASAAKTHMGTWVTDAAPESFVIPNGATFALNALHGYESAGTLNAYLYFKISVVTESGGVLSFNRTLVDWTGIDQAGSLLELGLTSGSAFPMGGDAGQGLSCHPTTTGTTIAVDERIAIEIGVDKTANKSGTTAFEYGCWNDTPDDSTATGNGTGAFGSCVGLPVNFSEANQAAWGNAGNMDEVIIPWITGTDIISWADIGEDWTAAKWETNAAAHYVNRSGGVVTAQFWVMQDDDYLYFACNNIIDSCIQNSDHHNIFICAGEDWATDLTTDATDYLFHRDITSGQSDTRAPTFMTTQGTNVDQGEFILKGDGSTSFPKGFEQPTWNATLSQLEFATENWVEGTDYRMGGNGAAATATPNPAGGNGAGSYSEFKIKKSKLNNWNGYTPLGLIVQYQCDVQGNGNTVWPRILGNQLDKNDWNLAGNYYGASDGATASSKVDADTMDMRPIMAINAHNDGTPPNTASIDQTLFAVTSASTATYDSGTFTATSAQTLSAVTSAATGKVHTIGAIAQSLTAATSIGAAELIWPAGVITQSLGSVSSTSTGIVHTIGIINQTLTAPTQIMTGIVHTIGNITQLLPQITQSGVGEHDPPVFAATSAQTLPFITQAGTGTWSEGTDTAIAAQSLSPVTQALNGWSCYLESTTFRILREDGSYLLREDGSYFLREDWIPFSSGVICHEKLPTVISAGNVQVVAGSGVNATSAQTLSAVTSALTGKVHDIGESTQTLPSVTSAGTATYDSGTFTATSAQTLSAVTSALTGKVHSIGQIAQTLPSVTSAGTATYDSGTFTATSAQTLSAVTSALTGKLYNTGQITQTLPSVTSAGTATYDPGTFTATSAQTLSAVTSALTGKVHSIAEITQTLSAITSALTGKFYSTGQITQTLSPITSIGTATYFVGPTGDVVQTLPSVTSASTATYAPGTDTGAIAQTLPSVSSASAGFYADNVGSITQTLSLVTSASAALSYAFTVAAEPLIWEAAEEVLIWETKTEELVHDVETEWLIWDVYSDESVYEVGDDISIYDRTHLMGG